MQRPLLSLLAVLVVSLAGGCASGGGGAGETPAPPVPGVVVTPQTASVTAGASVQVTATVTDVSNPTPVWDVNGIVNGNSTVGTINASGLNAVYTAPVPLPSPNNPVKIDATVMSAGAPLVGTAYETLVSAGLAPAAADRFLEQSTFGPTPQLVTNVSQTGLSYFLSSQFATPPTIFADPAVT